MTRNPSLPACVLVTLALVVLSTTLLARGGLGTPRDYLARTQSAPSDEPKEP